LDFTYLQTCGLATDRQPAEITLPFGSVKSLKSFVYINRAVRNKDIHSRNLAFSESLSIPHVKSYNITPRLRYF
jgi:hypothetical protein